MIVGIYKGLAIQVRIRPSENALLASNKFRNNQKICYFCGQAGHIKAYCDELKRLKSIEAEQEEKKKLAVANFSYCKPDSYHSDDEIECIALVSEVMNKKNEKWVVDSAAGSHMCKNENEMQNLRKLRTSQKVKVGNGEYVEAHSQGTVKLILKSRNKTQTRKVQLQNVLLVPELKYNLFSVSKAAELGKSVVFNKHGCNIVDNATKNVIGSGRKVDSLYYLECEEGNNESSCLRGMKKALKSVKQNNFQEEMMRRLAMIEEDNKSTEIRQRSVEEDRLVEEDKLVEECRLVEEDNTFKGASNQNQEEYKVNFNKEFHQVAIQEDTEKLKENTMMKVKQISTPKSVQLCSASSLSSTSDMSITNRQCYLMNLLFKEFPASSMTVESSDNDLD